MSALQYTANHVMSRPRLHKSETASKISEMFADNLTGDIQLIKESEGNIHTMLYRR